MKSYLRSGSELVQQSGQELGLILSCLLGSQSTLVIGITRFIFAQSLLTSFFVMILLVFKFPFALASESPQRFTDSSHPFFKIVGLVSTFGDGEGFMGNGFVIGEHGCYVVTNVHVAFGIGQDKDGRTILVDDVKVGHPNYFYYDFDNKTRKFRNRMKTTVVEFGNYVVDTRRGRTQDVAVLRLERCLGSEFAVIEYDKEANKKRFPVGELLSLSYGKLNGQAGILEQTCESFKSTPITGLMISNCYSVPGMSGSMILEKSLEDGVYRLVGIHQGRDILVLQNGSFLDVPVAVYARSFNKILSPFVGNKLKLD